MHYGWLLILGCLLWVINFVFVKDYPEHMLAQHTQQPPQQYSCWHSIRLVLKNSQIWGRWTLHQSA